MKREKRTKEMIVADSISKVFPIFNWAECWNCHIEFRYESGYAVTKWHTNNKPVYEYICSDCASTEEKILDICKRMITRPETIPPSVGSSAVKE